jgi:hypothetical protein
MSTWIGVLPVVGTSSLEGFAFGVLASGACFAALTAPWRPHDRDAVARYDLTRGHRPDSQMMRPGATAGEDLTPGAKPGDHRHSDDAGSPGSALPSLAMPPEGAGRALEGGAAVPAAKPDSGLNRAGGHRATHPATHPVRGPASGSAAGSPKSARTRRRPRHAAPGPGLGSKMTGLFGTRSLADDSRG